MSNVEAQGPHYIETWHGSYDMPTQTELAEQPLASDISRNVSPMSWNAPSTPDVSALGNLSDFWEINSHGSRSARSSITEPQTASSPKPHHLTVEPSVQAPAPKRKRGRPRIYRNDSANSDAVHQANDQQWSSAGKRSSHNQVERKYRETLNSGLERLRLAVPAVREGNFPATANGKPSKAQVLEGAISYIRQLEDEVRRKDEETREGGEA